MNKKKYLGLIFLLMVMLSFGRYATVNGETINGTMTSTEKITEKNEEPSKENVRSQLSSFLNQPILVNYQEISGLSQEEAHHQILDIANEALYKEFSDVYIDSIVYSEETLVLGRQDVQVNIKQGNVVIPIVEPGELLIYGGILVDNNKPFKLNEIAENPALIIERVQLETSTEIKDANVSWVNEKGEKINLIDFLHNDTLSMDESLLVKIEDKTNKGIVSYIPITEEYLGAHLPDTRATAAQISVTTNPTLITRTALTSTTDIGKLIDETIAPVFIDTTTKKKLTNYTYVAPKEWTKDTPSGTEGTMTYSIVQDNGSKIKKEIKVTLIPEGIISNLEDWEDIPLNSNQGVIENPINHSKIGFNKRGMSSSVSTQYGFVINDSANRNYVHSDYQSSFVPYQGESAMYWYGGQQGTGLYQYGFGGKQSNTSMNITSNYFLKNKKNGSLKQVIVEKNKSFVYVFDILLRNNLNFDVRFSSYNTKAQSQRIAVVEYADTDYIKDTVAMVTVSSKNRNKKQSNNQFNILGFAMKPNEVDRMSFLLRDKRGEWLSDYRKMAPGGLKIAPSDKVKKEFPYAAWGLGMANPVFGNKLEKKGIEQYDLDTDTVILENIDTAYQLASEFKELNQDEALVVGYQIFLGSEIKLMDLELNPDVLNFYKEDLEVDKPVKVDYILSDMDKDLYFEGPIYAYTDGSPEKEIARFQKPVGETHVDGTLEIPADLLLSNASNNEDGSFSSEIYLSAVNTAPGTDFTFLGSDEEILTVNSFELGADPKNQSIQLGSKWTKKPEELLVNKKFVATHDITYKYLDETPVDTTKLGLQKVKVSMTDETIDSERIYTVYVNVIEGKPPTTGITVVAHDFELQGNSDIKDATEQEIGNLIVDRSGAVAWDNETGLSEGIEISSGFVYLKPTSKPDRYVGSVNAKGKSGPIVSAGFNIYLLPDITGTLNEKAIPTDITLGERLIESGSQDFWKTWVTDVTYDGKVSTDYTATLEKADTLNIADGTVVNGKLKLSQKATRGSLEGRESVLEFPIMFKVDWGESLALGGCKIDLGEPLKQSSLALTLHDKRNEVYLSSSYGNDPYLHINKPFNSSLKDKPFMQLTHYPISEQNPTASSGLRLINGPNASKETTFSIVGNNHPDEVIHNLGEKGKLPVSYGDVIRIFVSNPDDIAMYHSNVGPTFSPESLVNRQTLFFTVTESGLKPLYISHLETEPVSILTENTLTEKTYETDFFKNVNNSEEGYFKRTDSIPEPVYENLVPIKFEAYPIRALPVNVSSTGTILVGEKVMSNSNYYVVYPYETTFTGSGPLLSFKDVPSTMIFGTGYIKSTKQDINQCMEDDKWGFNILDAREKREEWNIQAKASPFININGKQEEKALSLSVTEGKERLSLGEDYTPIFSNHDPKNGLNSIQWKKNEGFVLEVLPYSMENNAHYQSTVSFLLSNTPKT